ncbi:hypothetical protein EYF80_016635 [Liparis tanakae]|uniref:Uncharacterized protein n=1 Tax=Liparis tanakae TaxID=230148 RepID=A0A4Z2I513_9TELE|nr:hypothetical protein EYF80_016635 [Liparis tanakae]
MQYVTVVTRDHTSCTTQTMTSCGMACCPWTAYACKETTVLRVRRSVTHGLLNIHQGDHKAPGTLHRHSGN